MEFGGGDSTFPDIDGKSLQGETYALPEDFAGELNLVLVAFRREHQADVDRWLPVAKQLEDNYQGLRYYELPVMGRLYRPVRPFIDGGMRRGVTDEAAQKRTITCYLKVSAFRHSLDLPTKNEIYALLVDREGTVHWGRQGRPSESAKRSLTKVVEDRLQTR